MAEKEKIALCLEYPVGQFGGTEILVRQLIRGLSGRCEITLVSPDDETSLKNSGIAEQVQRHIVWKPAEVSRANAEKLARALSDAGVRLAHFHFGGVFGWGNRFRNQCPILYLRQYNIASCSTVHLVVHPLDGFCGAKKPLWFKLALFPIAWTSKLQVLRSVGCEVAVSQHDFKKLQSWYWPQKQKFWQLYHSRLQLSARRESSAPREPIILNIGHIAVRKGQLDLVEAFAQIAPRHPEWKLLLAGEWSEADTTEQIRALIAKHGLGDRVQLLGARKDAFELAQRAAIYVQPSHFEALGLALQEAMFYGCPAVGTNIGGIPELIEHQKTGLLVEARNPAMLAQAIESLIASPQLREQYGRAAAESIVQKGMTEDQMFANYLQLYESILRGR